VLDDGRAGSGFGVLECGCGLVSDDNDDEDEEEPSDLAVDGVGDILRFGRVNRDEVYDR
jgi:hypothetical protein